MDYEEKKSLLIKSLENRKGRNISLVRGSSTLFRKREDDKRDLKIDMRGFNEVINVDIERGFADVEARITYDEFVKTLLPYGFMPAVVPELKTITVGGGVTGISLDSTSFKEGFVHEAIEEIEILTAEGEIVRCSREENSDLFFGFPNSYGTLGYALRLRVKIIPVKKYVELEHVRYKDREKFFFDMEKICESGNFDFVDGSVFGPDEMYMTLGRFVDEIDNSVGLSDYTGSNIYYKSIRGKRIDYLKIYDYIWRWDTDWFWRSDTFGFQNPFLRAMVPKSLLGSATYLSLMRFSHRNQWLAGLMGKREWVIQDVPIPVENCAEFLEFLQGQVGVNPIWICPVRRVNDRKWPLYNLEKGKFYINFGFWGKVSKSIGDPDFHNKLVEGQIIEFEGLKSLYSSSFFKEDKFWEIYGGDSYFKLKKKYDPNSRFRSLFEKAVLGK